MEGSAKVATREAQVAKLASEGELALAAPPVVAASSDGRARNPSRLHMVKSPCSYMIASNEAHS